MKILMTADPELPVPPGTYGGIERIVEGLIHEYVARGHEVVLCAHPKSQVPCRLVPWKGCRSQDLPDTIRNTFTLAKLVCRERFDIIHSFSRLAYMTAVLPLRVPKIMSYQRQPSVRQVSKAVRLARSGSLVFTGCSEHISGQLTGTAESYPIFNFAPVERYTARDTVSEEAPLIFLGRIEEIKGTHLAIEVAKRTGRPLIIAGNVPADGDSYFAQKIRPFLDERIRYIGPVGDEQKNEWLGKSAALLMAVQWNEPFGIVMVEAMACGTPVLGLPFGAVPEVVHDGVNGYLCRDVDDMVRRVGDVAAIDRRVVRKSAEEKFSATKIATDYLELYARLVDRMKRG